MGERTKYTPGTFSWTDLTTTDQDGAKAFYTSLFGWDAQDNEAGDGFVYSMMLIDGKSVARTLTTSYVPTRPLRDGHHAWVVVAVDSAGLTCPAPAWSFTIRSVRVVRHSLGFTLAHGLIVRVFCAKVCTIRARLTTGRRGPVATLTLRTRRAGISTVTVPLSPALSRRLRTARRPSLTTFLLTRWAKVVRSVVTSSSW